MSVQTVRGHVVLRLPEGPIDLPAGHMAALDREMAHDIEAVEESTVLLTLAWAGASARRANAVRPGGPRQGEEDGEGGDGDSPGHGDLQERPGVQAGSQALR
jgi:hypothetical protein